MEYLLDTHALLWYLAGSNKLSEKARNIIKNPSNIIYVSIVSFWEISIKLSIGKIKMHESLPEIYNQTESVGMAILPLSNIAVFRIETLPLHHMDPFDRIIIATAETENFFVVSNDDLFDLYGISRVW